MRTSEDWIVGEVFLHSVAATSDEAQDFLEKNIGVIRMLRSEKLFVVLEGGQCLSVNGTDSQVSLPRQATEGTYVRMLHNHPLGSPPSIQDLQILLLYKEGSTSWIATDDKVYKLKIGKTISNVDKAITLRKIRSEYLVSKAVVLPEEIVLAVWNTVKIHLHELGVVLEEE